MNIQKFKSLYSAWMEEPKSYELSYYFFSCLVAFALYEGMYFFSFPIVEFLEFLGAALCLAFTGGFLLLFSNRYIRGFGFIYFFITITLYIFYSGHHLIFGTPPTSNVYVSLFETNSSETLEFLESYTNIGLFLKLLLPALLSLPLYGILKISHKRIGRKYIFLSFLFTMGTIASVANLKYKSPYRFLNQYLIYQKERATFRNTFSEVAPEDLKITKNNPKNDDTVILIIGESTSRNRMSLYGYHRETSPRLKAIGEDLFVYKNVISPNSHTVPSLEKALTFLNTDNQSTLKKNANIIQLAKLAGYETYWLSNQPPLGKDETPLNIMANNAHQTFWISDSPSFRYNNNVDGNLLPVLEKVTKKPGKKFIVLHLMGAHTSYKHRFLGSFKKFTQPFEHKLQLTKEQWEDYNNYDNAILYNDFVVSSLIDQSKKIKNSTVIYFSDHGEEVFDYRYVKGHTEALKSNLMFEVPFLVYTNQARVQKQLAAQFNQRAQSVWSIEDLIHSLHDIFGIETTYYQAQRSLFSGEFQEIPRMIAGEPYRQEQESVNCSATGMLSPATKTWVHRVNSKERFELLYDDFSGFEVDIVWHPSAKFFDVYHPPVESIGLNLQSMIELDKSNAKYFWLDLKNLNEQNKKDVVAELNRLDSLFQLKKRVIVESDYPAGLKEMREAGFYTSFYLPSYNLSMDAKSYLARVQPEIGPHLNAISQSGSMIEFMDAKFAGCDKLLWILNDSRESRRKIEDLSQRQDIKVILVKKRTKYYR